jgi:hypothetical protein
MITGQATERLPAPVGLREPLRAPSFKGYFSAW